MWHGRRGFLLGTLHDMSLLTKTIIVISNQFLELLRKDGIIRSSTPQVQSLTGGVSSDIYKIIDEDRTFVVKRALEKLKVEADWKADLSRNHYEAAYIRYVGSFLPRSVPQILSQGDGYFVMEYLEGFKNWKQLLMQKSCHLEYARQAGTLLGSIHRHSSGDPLAAQNFAAAENFIQLRVAPYLYHIAEQHVEVADIILEEAHRLIHNNTCLIHGDFSPKNILVAGERMVLVDCEVAFYGDATFDVSFLLCHLMLKGLYHYPENQPFRQLAEVYLQAYQKERGLAMNDFENLLEQVSRLVLMLLLARVDGKSPVEYLNEEEQDFTRSFTLKQLSAGRFELASIINLWFKRAF